MNKCIMVDCDKEGTERIDFPSKEYPSYFCIDCLKRLKILRNAAKKKGAIADSKKW